MPFPAIFLSHGAPTLLDDPCPARQFLTELGAALGRPDAVVVISAHWEASPAAVTAVVRNGTIHDFFGFPPGLYGRTYPAPGSPELAAAVSARLARHGTPCRIDDRRGLDHGAWVPLMLMYPDADLPVVQLSLLRGQGPEAHFRLGAALRGLGDSGVLVIGSGGLTHNLQALDHAGLAAPEPQWVTEFAQWMGQALRARHLAELLAYRGKAPFASRNHPTEEHILPLFVALGAGRDNGPVESLHSSTTFGALRMDAYAFR